MPCVIALDTMALVAMTPNLLVTPADRSNDGFYPI
jgi:hypothetical protein